MESILVREIIWAVHEAFRTIIPEPQDRIPITWRMVPYNTVAFLPFLFMAYLVRRPDTHLMRLLLLPTVIMPTLAVSFRFVWTDPTLNCYNWGQCLYAEFVIAKALEFAFVKEGRLKIGESTPGEVEKAAGVDLNGNASNPKPGTQGRHRLFPVWFSDAMEVICSMRGLGWDFGKGVYVPREQRSRERMSFLRATLFTFLTHYLFLDFLESLLKLFPGVGSRVGGSIFYSDLPFVQRYALSTAIHVLTGTALISGFEMVYNLMTLVGVGLLNNTPSSWPPILDNPWISDSMHIFWSKRWHQLLRQPFVVFGGYPGYWLAGHLGLIFGTFIASGIFHEASIYALGRGFDARVPFFFALQGPILVSERVWRRVTGRRVGGWPGRLWVYFVIVVLSQPMVDSWHTRGLAGTMIIPPSLSPSRRALFPFVRYVLGQLGSR